MGHWAWLEGLASSLGCFTLQRQKGDDILRQTELEASAIEGRAAETSVELERAGKHLINLEMKAMTLQAKLNELDKVRATFVHLQ